jgi:hypothetical protein
LHLLPWLLNLGDYSSNFDEICVGGGEGGLISFLVGNDTLLVVTSLRLILWF